METAKFEAKGNKHLNIDATVSLPYHQIIAEKVVKYSPNTAATMLDIGCGMGQIEKELTARNWTGTVIAADAYDMCLNATGQHAVVCEKIKLNEFDFDILEKVAGRKFDCVVLSHVLEHLHDPSSKMQQIMSLLKPGGVAILAVPNPSRPSVTINNMFQRHYANRGHVQAWDPSHWRVFLQEALKLNVIEYASDFVPLPRCRKIPAVMRASKKLAQILPWWGFSNIAVIRAA